MSKKDKPHQDIFTPAVMVNELLSNIPLKSGDKVLEPCCGDGNMINEMLDKCDGLDITACELQHKHVLSTYNRFKDREGVKITKEKHKTLFQHLFHFND